MLCFINVDIEIIEQPLSLPCLKINLVLKVFVSLTLGRFSPLQFFSYVKFGIIESKGICLRGWIRSDELIAKQKLTNAFKVHFSTQLQMKDDSDCLSLFQVHKQVIIIIKQKVTGREYSLR